MTASRMDQGGQGVTSLVLLGATAAPSLLSSGVSALSPLLLDELQLSRSQLGSVAVVLFTVTAALSLPFGRLSDRMPDAIGLIGIPIVVIAAVALAALAPGLVGLLVAAGLVGVALAASNPVTNRVVATRAAEGQRGRMIATKQAGVQVAQAVASLLCPLAATLAGWRIGLGVLEGVLVAVAVGTICWVIRTRRPASAGPARTASHTVVALQRPRTLIAVIAGYAVLMGFTLQAVLYGLPMFTHAVLDFPVTAGGATLLVLGATGFASRMIWGRLTDRVSRTRGPLIVIGVTNTLGLALFCVSAALAAPWAVWAGAVVFGVASTAVMVVLSAAVLRHFPLARVGSVSGITAVSTFGGFALGPVSFGAVADHSGFVAAWGMTLLASAAATVLPFVLRSAQAYPHPIPGPRPA